MKETGLPGQDVLTLLRLYVGPSSGQTDAAISNRAITEHAKRRAFNAAGAGADESVLNKKTLALELGMSAAEMSGVVLRCKNLGLLNRDFSVEQKQLLQLLAHQLLIT